MLANAHIRHYTSLISWNVWQQRDDAAIGKFTENYAVKRV